MAVDPRQEFKKRILEKSIADIVTLDDGFKYFWIDNKGALSSYALRIIADELDRLNSSWNEIIENDPALGEPDDSKDNLESST